VLQGDTRNLPLQGLFQTLEMSQQEGVLTVFYQRIERYFALKDRHVTLIGEKPGSSPTLQNILAGLRILTRQEYENVLSALTAPAAPGDALLQCKLLTTEQVLGPVREQVLECIYEIFEWRGARYRFEVKKIEPERLLFSNAELAHAMEFPVQGVLMEVARREDEWARIRAAIPHAHQIYLVTCPPEQLASFTTPEIPDEKRMQQLLRLFDGEHPLSSVLEESPVPAFFVFSILRLLLERGFVAAVPLAQKLELAEKLRNRRQSGRMAEIYRSILEEDPREDDIRRKLVLILEKRKENSRELVEHYHALAEGARRRGDHESHQQLVRRQLEMAPRDLAVHERVLTELAVTESGRDLSGLVHGYVETAGKLGQEGRAAEFLIGLSEDAGDKSPVYEQAGDLLARQGQSARAAEAYDNSMRTAPESTRRTIVRRVAEKLRRHDPKLADRWLKRIGAERRASRRGGSLVARLVAVLIVAAMATVGIHEWKAFQRRGEVVAVAERLLAGGEVEAARAELEQFREKWPWSFASLDLDRVWDELVDSPRPIGTGSGEIGTGGDTGHVGGDPLAPPPVEAFDFERFISIGRSLRASGDYAGALRHLLAADDALFSPAIRARLEDERGELDRYITQAAALAEDAHRLEGEGNLDEACALYQRLIAEFPHSPSAQQARLPLLIDVLPRHAQVLLDGRAVAGPPFAIRIPGDKLVELRSEAPGFEPFRQVLDPKETLAVTVRLQRKPQWRRPTGTPVDAEPMAAGPLVIVGGRDGCVVAWRASDGTEAWRSKLDNIGDAVGGFARRGEDIVFAATDGALYRLRIADGSRVYRLPLPDGGRPRGALSAVDERGRAVVVTTTSTVHSVDVDGGKIAWSVNAELDGVRSPAIAGDRILLGADTGDVLCLAATDGQRLWSRNLGIGLSTAATAGGRVAVIGTIDRKLVALSLTDGATVWSLPLDSTAAESCELGDEKVCVTTRQGSIVVARLADGTLAWSSAGHPGFRRPPRLVRDKVITVDEEGQVLVHRLADGVQLWGYSCGAGSGAPVGGDQRWIVVVDASPTLHLVPLEGEGTAPAVGRSTSAAPGEFAGR